MSTIALNWELGADMGHISRCLSIALGLREHGHRPILILRDISRAEALLGPHHIEYLQAPVWLAPVQGLPPDINFTETLYRFGFLYPEGLLSMARAWLALWERVLPELMLFDHAPTAMLAARAFNVPRLIMGNSFAIPPQQKPLPRFRWWTSGAGELPRLLETEARVTRHCNIVLEQLGARLIQQIADLYEAEATLLCGRAQLDGYGIRPDVTYIGPINNLSLGVDPQWPAGASPKIFAYLKAHYKHLELLLKAFSSCNARFLIYAPGLAERTRNQYTSSHVIFSPLPVRMDEVVKQCHGIVCHGGGMTDIALGAGKPAMLLPTQMEQTMTSHRAAALGAAVFMPMDGNPGCLTKLVQQLLSDANLAARACNYAASSDSTDQSTAVERVVVACDALLKGST